MEPAPTLIITLALAEESHQFFNTMRNTHYPKHCNYTPAHLTLLHRLPATLPGIDDVFNQLANRPLMEVQVTGITNMGNGVAYSLEAAALLVLHKTMQDLFQPYLISKDRRIWHPHITVQNKVTAFKAMQTTQHLLQQFTPFSIMATGINAWYYLKGPWLLKQFYPFDDAR